MTNAQQLVEALVLPRPMKRPDAVALVREMQADVLSAEADRLEQSLVGLVSTFDVVALLRQTADAITWGDVRGDAA